MICFVCEGEYDSNLKVCPYCGYENEEDDVLAYCPHSIDGLCIYTKEECIQESNFQECIEEKKLNLISNEEITDELWD